jgi:hypothetical protein
MATVSGYHEDADGGMIVLFLVVAALALLLVGSIVALVITVVA